jgi:hypothetical protein
MKLSSSDYLFGHVVRIDAKIGGFPNCVLLYIYEARSSSPEKIPELSKEALLLPPRGTNHQGWLKGVFRTIRNDALRKDQIFSIHCFYDDLKDRYVNEYGENLRKRLEPCGDAWMDSYLTIGESIFLALSQKSHLSK